MKTCPFCAEEIQDAAIVCRYCTHPVVHIATPWVWVFPVMLVGASILITLFGLSMLSQATAGVGVIAVACLFAIFARIAQAGSHRDQHNLLVRIVREKAWKEHRRARASGAADDQRAPVASTGTRAAAEVKPEKQ